MNEESNKNERQLDYINRINRVLDYIDQNLKNELNLATLASIANFSQYHFHRIFKSIVGEPLYKYIQRCRIEKAAQALKFQRPKSITEIAVSCGFNNPASFARTFKEYFGVSATTWRDGHHEIFSKNRKAESNSSKTLHKDWEETQLSDMYINPTNNNPMWSFYMLSGRNFNLEVKTLPEVTVAYLRHIGPFKGETEKWAALFQRLMKWAVPRDLLGCPDTQFFTVFRDDLNLTEFAKFKADACMSVPAHTQSDGEIGISSIPAGKYAVASFEIDAHEFEQAWDLVYRVWLPTSGYQPDERNCFERYLNDPKKHPQNKHFIEVCIPVKPL